MFVLFVSLKHKARAELSPGAISYPKSRISQILLPQHPCPWKKIIQTKIGSRSLKAPQDSCPGWEIPHPGRAWSSLRSLQPNPSGSSGSKIPSADLDLSFAACTLKCQKHPKSRNGTRLTLSCLRIPTPAGEPVIPTHIFQIRTDLEAERGHHASSPCHSLGIPKKPGNFFHSELEKTHKDQQIQLLTLHRTTPSIPPCP